MQRNFFLVIEPSEHKRFESLKSIWDEISTALPAGIAVLAPNSTKAHVCNFQLGNLGFCASSILTMDTLELALLLELKYQNMGYDVKIEFYADSFRFEAKNQYKVHRITLEQHRAPVYSDLAEMQYFYQQSIKTLLFC